MTIAWWIFLADGDGGLSSPFSDFPEVLEEPVLLAAADLGEVRIPPLDSLAHDDAFFATLRRAPILGGLLDGLEGYYGR